MGSSEPRHTGIVSGWDVFLDKGTLRFDFTLVANRSDQASPLTVVQHQRQQTRRLRLLVKILYTGVLRRNVPHEESKSRRGQ